LGIDDMMQGRDAAILARKNPSDLPVSISWLHIQAGMEFHIWGADLAMALSGVPKTGAAFTWESRPAHSKTI